jgi:hypothetical protein
MTKSVDHLLREALEAGAGATPPTRCLDADTAAAFADDTLSARERSSVEGHLADCGRCQALLAALVKITPPPAARAWWRRPAVAWLVPLTVAATAVIIWVNAPRRTNVDPQVQLAREATRPVESESSQAARAVAAPSAAPVTQREGDLPTPRKNVAAARQPRVLADRRVSPAPAVAPEPPAAAEAQRADTQLSSTSLSKPATPQPSVAAAGSVSSRTAQAEPPSSVAETVTGTREASKDARSLRLEVAHETAIVSANPVSRWRVGSDGVVQHSADGGSTWQTQATGVNGTLTAGSSPSRSVCWLVGREGVVLISTDEGGSWQRLAFPEAADLVSIRAIDDTSATVRTADGRTFSTSDRGLSWRR